MLYDNVLWAKFAAAALSSGDLVGPAASRADSMLSEYKKRFSKNPLKSEPEDVTSHRPTNNQ